MRGKTMQPRPLLKVVQSKTDARLTSLKDYDSSDLPTISQHQVQMQERLGSGQFCTAFSIHITDIGQEERLRRALNKKQSVWDVKNAVGLNVSAYTKEGNMSEHTAGIDLDQDKICSESFALKRLRCIPSHLSPDSIELEHMLEHILQEAKLLQRLPFHPHLLQLVALSENFWEDPSRGFLVVESLHDTLDSRLVEWKQLQQHKRPPRFRTMSPWKRHQSRTTWLRHEELRRVQVMLGISRALQHLHSHSILYRDLKPSNIGFAQSDGKVRLFDFGFARTVYNKNDSESPRMTGVCGSIRYMSPEVATSIDTYSYSADVYSFSLILWQVCSLLMPFGPNFEKKEWFENVVMKQIRPSLKHVLNPQIKDLCSEGWNPIPSKRPAIDVLILQLEAVFTEAKNHKTL